MRFAEVLQFAVLVCLTTSRPTTANRSASSSFGRLASRISQFNAIDKEKPEVQVLNSLINKIVDEYLNKCHLNIVYDDLFDTDLYYKDVLRVVLSSFDTVSYEICHVQQYSSKTTVLRASEPGCINYMVFCHDPEIAVAGLGHMIDSRVLVVTVASSWQIQEFFTGQTSRNILNMLVASAEQALQENNNREVADIKLYTHDMYVDGLGSSAQRILTTWKTDRFTRPEVDLYPAKLTRGFRGHRFIVSAIDKPPLTFRSGYAKIEANQEHSSASWDGVEIRLLQIVAEVLNFTLDVHDATLSRTRDEAEDRVIGDLVASKADFGISGLYMTNERQSLVDFSPVVMQDCGTFTSLGSFALSKYRAIFGPFHWSIWIMVVFTYVIAIFPIAFTNNRDVKTLCKNPKQLESMCCYMFGTYTNLFTFKGVKSWTNAKMGSTRLFIGTYWIFTIIVTTAYTSSIIAFITLPEQPVTVDTSYQLVDQGYRVITLNKGGWQYYFNVTNDTISKKLMSNVKLMNNLEDAIDFIVKTRFILDYAFLGSKISLTYLTQNNFLQKYKNKKIFLHVASECYVPFNIGLAYKKNFIFRNTFNNYILRSQQSGLLAKIVNDIEWEIAQHSGIRKSMMILAEDRQLTLDDVQGMFILLGGGILLSAFILGIEYIKRKREKRRVAQVKLKKTTQIAKRSKSVVVKEITAAEPFRPLTTY